jgi:hypothetical protein
MERALWFLQNRRLKDCKRELLKLDTNESNILLYYLFNLNTGEQCILDKIDQHYGYIDCECRHPYRFILGTPPTCDDYIMLHKDFKDFKGFWYYAKWTYQNRLVYGNDKHDVKNLAIEHLQNHQILPCLTYLPLYYLTKDISHLQVSADAGIPRACYEMYKLSKELDLLTYAAKTIHVDRLWQYFEIGSYHFLKYAGLNSNTGLVDDNPIYLYFSGKRGSYRYNHLYKNCNTNAQNAVFLFMIICKRFKIPKDIGLIISKQIWKSRKHEPHLWFFDPPSEGWLSWVWSKISF